VEQSLACDPIKQHRMRKTLARHVLTEETGTLRV
jgi:hypothetical protein